MKTIILLTISNTFTNLAWYGHLKFKNQPLQPVILELPGCFLRADRRRSDFRIQILKMNEILDGFGRTGAANSG